MRRVAIALLALVLAVPSVAAHAVWLASDPTKGERLDEAPAFVEITFTEPTDAAGTVLEVLDAAGTRVDLGDATGSGGATPTWRLSLQPNLPDGAYRLVWQTLSATDGHVEKGYVGFAVGDAVAPASSDGHQDRVDWAAALGRLLAFTGLALAFGAALFLVWVPGAVQVPRGPVLRVLLVATGLHLAGVLLLGGATLRKAGLDSPGFAATDIGSALVLRIGLGLGALAFAAIANAPRMPAKAPPYLAVLLLAGSGLLSARFGHASLVGLAGIAVDALHLLAATTWIGGLLVFLWLLAGARHGAWTPEQVRAGGIRFGTAALMCVFTLLGAGVAATLSILGPPGSVDAGAVAAATWGKALAAKLALTTVMLGLALVNRYAVLEPATTTGLAGRVQAVTRRLWPRLPLEPPSLGRLLRVEAVLGVVTLACAAILTSVSPPSTAEAPGPAPLEAFASGLDYHASLLATPAPVAGARSDLVVRIATHGGTDLDADACGRVRLTLLAGGTGEPHDLTSIGSGEWALDDVLWTTAGPVEARLDVSSCEVFADHMTFAFNVRPNA